MSYQYEDPAKRDSKAQFWKGFRWGIGVMIAINVAFNILVFRCGA